MIQSHPTNIVTAFKDFHISYEPDSELYGSDTTAIVLKHDVFLILNGCHNALDAIAKEKGLQGCFDYFLENIHLANPKSEHQMACGYFQSLFGIAEAAKSVLGEENIQKLLARTKEQENEVLLSEEDEGDSYGDWKPSRPTM